MTSACNFRDTLMDDTQVFLEYKISFFEICLHLINSNFTPYFLTPSTLSSNAGTSKEVPPDEIWNIITRDTNLFLISISSIELLRQKNFSVFQNLKIASKLWTNSIDSDVFYVELSSNQPILPRSKTPIVLNSAEMPDNDTREMISISSVASPEPHSVTIHSDSN